MPLTALALSQAKPRDKAYKLFDGGGLFLLVSPSGNKSWKLAYRVGGVQKKLTIGPYPRVGLSDARKQRDEAKRLLDGGTDPSAAKKEAKAAVARRSTASTFEDVSREWHAWYIGKKELDPVYAARILKFLEADVFPAIGGMDIATIDAPALRGVIAAIEARGAVDLPTRILRNVGKIFRYAMAHGKAATDPTIAAKEALSPRRRVQHRLAFKAAELPEFFERLNVYKGENFSSTTLALRFTILTVVRTGETRFATWAEIEGLDGKAPLWRIPPDRMKMHREHIVPLSPPAVALLKEARARWPRSKWVFPSNESADGSLSENAMLYLLYRLGYHKKATVHGFRGTFSTIANEFEDENGNGWNSDWIEMQLAHSDGDDVRGAYNAAEWLPQRRRLLQWWADYVTTCGLLV